MSANNSLLGVLVSILIVCGGQSMAVAQDMGPLWDDGAFEVTFDSLQALEPESMSAQMVATYYTMVGRQDRVSTIDAEISGPSRSCVEQDQGIQWQSGRDWLLNAAEDRRVVMFNENHFRIEARLFVGSLLEDLRELGFTHMGFEAFQTPWAMAANAGRDVDEKIPNWSYSPEQGFYTREPAFAALIRQAQALGFTVFGYESNEAVPEGASPIEIREEAQANNIITQLEAAGPDARLVVFAGWAHITEAPLGDRETEWMAARFKAKTGIDPLTVDLTSCGYEAAPKAQATIEQVPIGKVALDSSSEVIVSGRYEGAVEAQIHLPVPASSEVAVGFYRRALGVPVSVPEALRSTEEPVLVRARRSDQEPGDMPVDQVLLEKGEDWPLYLMPGYHYELISHRGDGSVIGKAKLYAE